MSTARKSNNHSAPQSCQPAPAHSRFASNPTLRNAWTLIQLRDYVAAANILGSAGRDPQIRNALSVCLMRSGCVDLAVDILRSIVLKPGTVVQRPEMSDVCKRNFATALLMSGFPNGALEVLDETADPQHPVAQQLRQAIKRWERTLSWIRLLDWKLNGIHPSDSRVPIDFEPGEFESDANPTRPEKPGGSTDGSLKLAA
ncbi:tetratricopeptide repeat protein [Stieleria varia]|uniref:Tetratricopeptide repeat protein n=1 Tax=Stieleria varia TaxID=2528005 RepID=A0A5C5ZW06_9BACT|nr:tetratricopeptide repeat protein [Stieleria varia]TWT91285.1 hypothetical protein Pla52n_66190 [Stieleria varia]